MKRLLLPVFALIGLFSTSQEVVAQEETMSFTLQQARDYAREHSYFTRKAVMDEDVARKKIKETTAIGLPQVSAKADFNNFLDIPTQMIPDFTNPDNGNIPVQFGTNYQLNAGVTVSQIVFDGSYIVGLMAAKTYEELAVNARIKSEQEIVNSVTTAYASVLIAEANLETLEGNKEYLEQTLNDTRALYNEGFAEEQDVLQLELLVSSSNSQLNNGKRYLTISRNLLKYQMGLSIQNTVVLVDDLDFVINYGNDRAVVNQTFDYAANIDFRLAMSDQRLQELNFKNTKVQYLPKVNAFYNYQETYQNNELALSQHDWFPTNLWGFSVSVPVFSSFMRKYQVDQAKIEFEKAQLNSDQVSQELTLNYSTLLSNYEFAMERFKNNEKNLDLVKLILEKETVKFNEGISTSLDLANAQLQFFEIQASYIQSLSDLIEIRSELDKILNNY